MVLGMYDILVKLFIDLVRVRYERHLNTFFSKCYCFSNKRTV